MRQNERGERLGTFALYTYKPDGRPNPNPPIYPTREEAERQGRAYVLRNPDAPKGRTRRGFGKQFYIRDMLFLPSSHADKVERVGRGA